MKTRDKSAGEQKKKSHSNVQLCVIVDSRLKPIFYQFLGQGFMVYAQTDCSVEALLCQQLGIDPNYLSKRIQTIFLNSQPVDNIADAIVEDKSVLALSGPMPGLVGATLRRGGFYAAMRSQISYDNKETAASQGEGQITFKLFNLVQKELGPKFLQEGIWIKGAHLRDFLSRHLGELETGCTSTELDGKPIEMNKLLEIDWDNKLVRLQVTNECTA